MHGQRVVGRQEGPASRQKDLSGLWQAETEGRCMEAPTLTLASPGKAPSSGLSLLI